MKKLLILAALTAASFGQPVLAQPAPANPSMIVQHKDLDLRTEAGARTLDRRIWRAAVAVCGSASDFDLAGQNDVRHCRNETRTLASAQAEMVIANASHGQPIRVSSIQK
ncbi:UrcA family protein [Sphingopyxis witflariensis]|uniref:UrcA family protein n=1 Tax=Sphingopyxis witflariensis TaxID=173675 RepID=A0A246JTE3_9SPHN|nr:UrcA family protein [Sphingopyxis witflariensis]OWQ96279.1 UrcA family protein [Sphingopyxis witflariensis]